MLQNTGLIDVKIIWNREIRWCENIKGTTWIQSENQLRRAQMRETGIHAESEQFVPSYKCSLGIFTQQRSTVVYKEKQINLHNMESVHTRILTSSSISSFPFSSSLLFFFFFFTGFLVTGNGLVPEEVGSFSSTISSDTTLFFSLDFSFNFSSSTTQSIIWSRKSASKLNSHLSCPFSNSLFNFLRLSSVLSYSHWKFTPFNIFQATLVLWIVINHLLPEIGSDENQGLFKSGEALSSSLIKITPLSASALATMSSRKSIISFMRNCWGF